MSWYDQIRKTFGYKKGLEQLTEEEMTKIIRDIQMQCRQLENKIDAVEKEQTNLAQQVLKSSKMKAAMIMEKLKQKKAMGKFYVKAYVMASRNAMAMESVLEIRKVMGSLNNQLTSKLETLSPTSIAAFMEVMQNDFSVQSMDSDKIMETLEGFTGAAGVEENDETMEELARLQDSILENADLSDEEKAKKLMEIV